MRRAALALAAALAGSGPAAAEGIILSLSSREVAIGSTYAGAELVAFGVITRDNQTLSRRGAYDVVVTVRGPPEAPTIRRKERLGPIWINRAQQKFISVPAALGIYSSRPLPEIADARMRSRLRLGVEGFVNSPVITADRGVEDDPFRTALLRLKIRDGLYGERTDAVEFVTPEVFRASLQLAATAPPGAYEVEVTLFAEGVPITTQRTSFDLVKTGFEERVTSLARDRRVTYGLATAAMAILFGWIASVIFRRD
ncbi:MAG: TIGR02186 family protein [Methylobacteriaceae bacterium]|nr:TIGR02186 family protein [Methylobacteriaceae bacterium]